MSIDIYQDILELWGDRTNQILTDSITPIDAEGGLPAYTIEAPLRWEPTPNSRYRWKSTTDRS